MDSGIHEVRVALTVDDFDGAARLYREGLGLTVEQAWSAPQGRVIILPAGRATIELLDRAQAEFVDRIEVGARVGGPVRLALGVSNAAETGERLRALGARVVHAPVLTPWGHRNMRLETPDGLQLTLFQLP